MNFKKFFAFLLASLLFLTALVSCDSTKDEPSTNAAESSETESDSETEANNSAAGDRFDYFNTDLSQYIKIDRSVYSNLSVELSSDYLIDESDVQTYIESKRMEYRTAANGNTQVTDNAIKKGDSAFIYYKGFLDGEEFNGGSNWDDDEPFELIIGSGRFIPGFEDGLVGVIPGDTSEENPVSVNVTFPENYYENLAGKDVVFKVWVVYSIQYDLPEYNDAFITETLEFPSTGDNIKEEFEAHLMSQLTAEMNPYAQSEVLNSIWSQLLEKAEILEYPESEIDYYYNAYLDQYEYYKEYYTYYGYSFESLDDFVVAYLGLEEGADWKTEIRESCKINVAQNLIFHAIARNEDIIITDADYQGSITYYVNYYKSQGSTLTAEQVEERLGSDSLKQHALVNKINALLEANCTVTYGDQ